MVIKFGKHRNRSVEMLLLSDPDYVKWIVENQDDSGGVPDVRLEVQRLITKFNLKPFQVKCAGCHEKTATRISLYRNDFTPMFWCGDCDPYDWGAAPGTLTVTSDYLFMIDHNRRTTGGSRKSYKNLIGLVAEAKGFTIPLTEKRVKLFFSEPLEEIPPRPPRRRKGKLSTG
jgi:hypothetical protein